jgi:hypothetical protein
MVPFFLDSYPSDLTERNVRKPPLFVLMLFACFMEPKRIEEAVP